MNVADILNNKGHDVATISKDRLVADVVEILRTRRIGALIVTGSGEPLAGMISERDIVRALSLVGPSVLGNSVESLMSAEVFTCDLSTSCAELMGQMTTKRIRHIPVLENQRLVGLVSVGDVVKARFDELERDRRELLDYVTAR